MNQTDPVFVTGGGANRLDGGADPIYFTLFLKNSIKEILGDWRIGDAQQECPP